MGDADPAVGRCAHRLGNSCRVTSHENNIPFAKGEVPQTGRAPRGQEHEAALTGRAPGRKVGPRIVSVDRQGVEVVHPGAPEAAIIDSNCRLDDGRIHAEAGAGAHHRAGVLRNIGLKQGEQERGMARPSCVAITCRRPKTKARRRGRKMSPSRVERGAIATLAYGHPNRSMRKTASNVDLRRGAAIDDNAGNVPVAMRGPLPDRKPESA